jgi:Carboxypeptidase regulatory-like domain
MGRLRAVFVVVVGCVLLYPAVARAQATLAGVVRDTSGAVIPGVTVEASSDALIERVRTTVTDGSGQWRIVDLRPGIYVLKFSLTGFSQVVREGVEVAGSGVTTIVAELSVGNLQETVTVQAETPVVDVQSVKREVVLQSSFVEALPATRNYAAILSAIPALNVGISVSAETTPDMQLFYARGGQIDEGRITIDGLTVAAPFGGGGVSSVAYNVSDATELQVQISGGLGESETGGPVLNIVPRSGGNTFSGSVFGNAAGDWSRSDNIDDELRSFGIQRGQALLAAWDISGSFGGPIKRDRLWFYGTIRNFKTGSVVDRAARENLNAGNPNAWTYQPNPASKEVRDIEQRDIYSGRLTGQLGKHRWSFSQENQYRCDGSTRTPDGDGCRKSTSGWTALGTAPGFFGHDAPEADAGYYTNPYYVTQATWTMPKTSRLLLEAGYSRLAYRPVFGVAPEDAIMDLIPMTRQFSLNDAATGLPIHGATFSYRAIDSYTKGWARSNSIKASAAYVTGSHNMKVGYQGSIQLSNETEFQNPMLIEYRVGQPTIQNGVVIAENPNRFTINLPDWQEAGRTVQHSVYVQDAWTMRRLTLQAALRYDHAYSWSPAEGNGTTATSQWNAQPITFERTVSVRGYDDITPRLGLAYDLFGTGKTALKFNLGKYLDAATNDSNYTVNNPANRLQRDMDRNWTDNDGDYIVDCDILDFRSQGPTTTGHVDTCAAPTGNEARFGNFQTGLTEVNPAILGGWGVRPWDWQVGFAVQQEVLPRVSVEVAYNRRWFGNFTVTTNRALAPADYVSWTATAPSDPRLPNGGGYTLTQNFIVRPEAAGRTAQNYVTFETDFGPARINYWHGVEVTANARMRNGLTFQGGTSTGRELDDRCAAATTYVRVVGNLSTFGPRNCRNVEPYRTSFKGSASYTVPKADVLISAITRFTPSSSGISGLTANYAFPNSVVIAQVGPHPNLTATGTQTVNLLDNWQMLAEERHYQVDMRFAKIFRFAGTRAEVGIDLYNIFNVNTPTIYDGSYDPPPAVAGGQWLNPTSIVQPRFARLNLTFNF